MMRSLAFAALSVVVVVACSSTTAGGGGGTFDCSFLSGPNCYKSTAVAAMSCLPDSMAQGTLSADGKTCTYADGHVIAFQSAVTLPLPMQPLFNFTLTNGGAQCLTFNQTTSSAFTLTTSAGTFTENANETTGTVTAVCPGGATYSASGASALAVLSCDGGLSIFPGTETSSSTSSFSLMLLGTGLATPLPVFTCVTGM